MNNQDNTNTEQAPVLTAEQLRDAWAQLYADTGATSAFLDTPSSNSTMSDMQRSEIDVRYAALLRVPGARDALGVFLLEFLTGRRGPQEVSLQIVSGEPSIAGDSDDDDSDDDSDDEDIVEGMVCSICMGRQVDVQFNECAHGACKICVKRIWRTRRQYGGHFPKWFPCHECRTEVWSVGMLSEKSSVFGPTLAGKPSFEVLEWELVLQWILKTSVKLNDHYEWIVENN